MSRPAIISPHSRHCPTLGVPPDQLAPGVLGVVVWHGGALYLPWLAAITPGRGDVGRYLDGLPADKTIRVPCVFSAVLEGMLRRRGYRLTCEWSQEFGEDVAVWERKARACVAAAQ